MRNEIKQIQAKYSLKLSDFYKLSFILIFMYSIIYIKSYISII